MASVDIVGGGSLPVPDRLVMDQLYEATTEGSIDAEPYATGLAGGRVDLPAQAQAFLLVVRLQRFEDRSKCVLLVR